MTWFTRFGDWIIARAQRTPYYPIHNAAGELYMERFWLVPYRVSDSESSAGCGPVSFRRRPIAWLLQQFDIAVRVHHIVRSDDDRALHDHPWSYFTLILRGGYLEVTEDGTGGYWKAGSCRFRRAQSWHRLIIPSWSTDGAWTLFITFRKQQPWGFLVDGRKVWWRDFLHVYGTKP